MDKINKCLELLEKRRKEQNIDNELSKIKLQKKSIENRVAEIKIKSLEISTPIPKENFGVVKKVSIGTPFVKVNLKKVREVIIQASKYELRNKELIKIKESEDLKKYIQERFGKGFNAYKLLVILKAFKNNQDINFDFENFYILDFFKKSLEDFKYFLETFAKKYDFDITLLNLIDTEENRVLLN